MEKRNVSIQLLRVTACLLVFMIHFGERMGFSGAFRQITDFGKYGVQLFFLISGYLAGKTFFNNPKADIKAYYIKRAIAILPLYYLVVTYYFITENILNKFLPVIPVDQAGIGWFRYIFMLNGFVNSEEYFWNNLGITWTIPIFCCFYLVAPWLLRKNKTLFGVTLVWVSVLIITRVANLFYYCTIFANLNFLFLGAVLYVCVNKRAHIPAAALCLAVSVAAFAVHSETFGIVFVFSAVILIITATNNLSLPCWLQNTVNTLDKYSYTLYLVHGIIFCSILDRLNHFGVSKIIIGIIATVGTFIATWLVGRFVERPLQSYFKKRLL